MGQWKVVWERKGSKEVRVSEILYVYGNVGKEPIACAINSTSRIHLICERKIK